MKNYLLFIRSVIPMNFLTKLFRSRDKPTNPKGLASRRSYHFSGWTFMFGKSVAGKSVNVTRIS